MIGAIAGDVIGSIYEFDGIKSKDFPLFDDRCSFTDDSVLTVAVADVIMHGGTYAKRFQHYYRQYPGRGYGGFFHGWAELPEPRPYGSFGNGSAMRVSPVGFAFGDLATVLAEAKRSAEVTHNHPEGIKGAQATAAAIFLARTGNSKDDIRSYVEHAFGYDLGQSLDALRPGYEFNETCQGTVPAALLSFLEASDFEDAVRNAISLGGDADTLACIAGGIAEAFYGGVPLPIKEQTLSRLDSALRSITEEFAARFRSAPWG
ncbi:MAG TPA: ADP-ribosylglycohydrolase family protein [Candidatus Angelobacter sp.]